MEPDLQTGMPEVFTRPHRPMATNQFPIVCTTKATHESPSGYTHKHIVEVGVSLTNGWQRRYTVAEVRQMIASGWVFYRVSQSTGNVAYVEASNCCGIPTIRSTPDAIRDNSLDTLPACV